MIDSLIYGALTAANLAPHLSSGGAWRVYPLRSLGSNGIPASPAYPYVQYGDGGTAVNAAVRETRKSVTSTYDVYVYDEPGSYKRIKDIHDLIQDNLGLVIGLVTATGWTITDLQFQSYGGDGFDPVNQQFSKRASYRVVSSTARQ
jgi:hypothetical protein